MAENGGKFEKHFNLLVINETKPQKPKKRKTYTSRRTELAIRIMAENGGVVSAAMREAGFSDEYARQPQKFIATKTFKELSEIMLPDIKVLARHTELLGANKLEHTDFPNSLTDEDISKLLTNVNCILQAVYQTSTAKSVYFWAPDYKARKDAIDLAYKLKGYIKTGGAGGPVVPVQINFTANRDKYNK
jgi:hypothetical protein